MLKSENHIAVPPGATIKEQLVDRGMTQKEFAERMNYSEKHISKLINGDVNLTQETALRLESVLGLPANFWNKLESKYREKITRINQENSFDRDREHARCFPYTQCANHGWVPSTKKIDEKVNSLRKFFHVAELESLFNTDSSNIAYRKLNKSDNIDYINLMWIQQAKNLAENIKTSSIDIKHLEDSIEEIKSMTMQPPAEFIPKLEKLLADSGIAFVILPILKGSFTHGVSFVFRKKIILAINDRRKDADIFWFSLFHELGHIVLGHIHHNNDISTEQKEKEADAYAEETLLSSELFDDFIQSNNITQSSIIEFANEQGIHPGIVVGRLQKKGYLEFNKYRNLKQQYELEYTND